MGAQGRQLPSCWPLAGLLLALCPDCFCRHDAEGEDEKSVKDEESVKPSDYPNPSAAGRVLPSKPIQAR